MHVIRQLSNKLKETENAKLKLEKKLLQEQVDTSNDRKANQMCHKRDIKQRDEQLIELQAKLEFRDKEHSAKLEEMRDRYKRVEATVYERVEKEYSEVLQEKEDHLHMAQERIIEMEMLMQKKDQQIV